MLAVVVVVAITVYGRSHTAAARRFREERTGPPASPCDGVGVHGASAEHRGALREQAPAAAAPLRVLIQAAAQAVVGGAPAAVPPANLAGGRRRR